MKKTKKNSKLLYLIILVMFILLVFLSFLIGSLINNLYQYSKDINNNSTKDTETLNIPSSKYNYANIDLDNLKIEKEKDNEINNNIEIIKTYVVENNYLYVLIKNNNNYPIEFKGYLNLYDKEGYKVKQNTGSMSVIYPNTEAVLSITLLIDDDNYDTYAFSYVASKVKSYNEVVVIDSNSLNITKVSDKILVLFDNNTNKDLFSVGLACIYYKNNEIVAIKNGYMIDLKNGQTGEVSFYDNLLKTDYDDYRIVVSSAYVYNKDWK